jgi:K+-transporting ATPase ATPase A chain
MFADILYIIVFIAVLCVVALLLGSYMALVFDGRRNLLSGVAGPLERLAYRLCRIQPAQEMTWKEYSAGMHLSFSE